jgi:hypothetical protein
MTVACSGRAYLTWTTLERHTLQENHKNPETLNASQPTAHRPTQLINTRQSELVSGAYAVDLRKATKYDGTIRTSEGLELGQQLMAALRYIIPN